MADPRDELGADRIAKFVNLADDVADAMQARIRHVIADGLDIRQKADASLVTTADVEAEKTFRAWIEARHPDHGVVGEELGDSNPGSEFRWVVDPIDGTAEFARDIPVWGTIIALYFRNEPVAAIVDHPDLGLRCKASYGAGAFLNDRRLQLEDLPDAPFTGRERVATPSPANYAKNPGDERLFHALCKAHPNIRVLHTCYTHTLAASGGVDAAIEWCSPIWDVAACRIFAEESGGRYELVGEYAADGEPRRYSVVFGRPRMVEALAALFQGQG